MSVERSVSRGEARAGAVESLKKPSGERERRACASLPAPFSARRHSRGVLARHRLPPVRASGRRPNRGCIPARIGRVAVKRLAPDRQSPTSSPLATLSSLCAWSGARARACVAALLNSTRSEGGWERERGRRISVLASSRLPSRIYGYIYRTSRQFHTAVRGLFLDFSVSFQSPTAALVAPPSRARGTEQDLRNVNDPSAGSPTETLLRLLLPLNDQVWSSSRQHRQCRRIAAHQSEDLTKSFNR